MRTIAASSQKGELGRLAGVEDELKVKKEDSSYTRPEEVNEFVAKTGVDSLAIAIGTSHGAYKFKPGTKPRLALRYSRESGRAAPGFPIVLHGASSVIPEFVEEINKYGGKMDGALGVPEDMLRKAASMAVCKTNIDSDLRLAMTAAIRKHFAEHPSDFDPRQHTQACKSRHQGNGSPQDSHCSWLQWQGLSEVKKEEAIASSFFTLFRSRALYQSPPIRPVEKFPFLFFLFRHFYGV